MLTGNLIEDCKYNNSGGKEYLTFMIAVDDIKDKKNTRFYSCILYGANENRRKYLVKGAKVNVVGGFKPSIYYIEGKEPKLNLDVMVEMIDLIYVPK